MKHIKELQELSSTTSNDIDINKSDRVFNEVLLPKFKCYAKKFKDNKISLTDNLFDHNNFLLMKELFNSKYTIQSLVETEMKPYLEDKGFKVIRSSPNYSVDVAWYMKKYCMYVVDSNDENFDKSVAGYDEVKNCSINYTESDDFEPLLRLLVSGINNEEYSDQNWYYITDEDKRAILMS